MPTTGMEVVNGQWIVVRPDNQLTAQYTEAPLLTTGH
jgi:hypothetical protein